MIVVLGGIAVVLTLAMFISRQAMLGFACVIFWLLFGADCIYLSTAPWDIYFTTGFGAMLGMTIVCGMGAFGLREKKDSGTDEDDYVDEDKHVTVYNGETTAEAKQAESGDLPSDDSMDGKTQPSARTRDLHDRAKKRKTGLFHRKPRWGEFK
jgi:hypothetical protein